MKTWASFPGHYDNKIPDLSELEDLFLAYTPQKWTDDGCVQFEQESGERIRLTVIHHPNHGIWLQHENKASDGKILNYFSYGDPGKMDHYVEAVEDALTLEGLYITPPQAWPAVRYFIESKGGRTDQINWISEQDLPEGKHWLVSSDCV